MLGNVYKTYGSPQIRKSKLGFPLKLLGMSYVKVTKNLFLGRITNETDTKTTRIMYYFMYYENVFLFSLACVWSNGWEMSGKLHLLKVFDIITLGICTDNVSTYTNFTI